MKIVQCLAVASLVVLTACASTDQLELPSGLPAAADTGPLSADTDNGWPRTVASGTDQITIYQPQIESWEANRLQARAAVAVQTAASAQPVYGVIGFSARTEVDRENRLVSLQDLQLTRTSFPSDPQRADAYAAVIRPQIVQSMQTVALDRLQASLAVTRAEALQKTVDVKNDPPQILYSTSPALLVLIDGEPVLRPVAGTSLSRIVNTRALMLLDKASGTYYFFLANRWMQARAPTGPWTPAQNVPPSLETAKQQAVQQKLVDLLDAAEAQTIYVSTKPAELIQTGGQPQLESISGTRLLEVTNSPSDLFLDEAQQRYYVLLSGRWYRSPSLEHGPWAFVSAKELPADFARIPENHPKGAVLASVAGTPQAEEARIANHIPQTATVVRSQAQLAVQYDGAPQWQPIPGTALAYATNSATPVIRVAPDSYYAVSGGIWFTAASPTGPWAVASSVPPVIYSIPPSSPIYPVTHVYVYGATPEVVYTGYTPGYLGSYVSTDGVVVFGTGYAYPHWVGSEWIGYPATFGFDVGWSSEFGWGFLDGFALGAVAGPLFHPWWGPFGWGWGHRDIEFHNFHHDNIYRSSRDHGVYRDRWDRHEFANHAGPSHEDRTHNSVYAGHDGHAYRGSPSGWERHGAGGWHPSPGVGRGQANEFAHESAARNSGSSHWSAFRGAGAPHASGFHGGVASGGFHGGASHGGGLPGGGGFHGGGGGGFHGGGGGHGGGHR
jgi:hypothetical protein